MDIKNKLSEKKYWDSVHKDKSVTTRGFFKLPLIKNIVTGFNNRELYKICEKYFKKKYKNIFEIGCAPGNYLIKFNELFGLQPNGIEYSQDGVNILNKNFKKNNIQGNIIHGDFFDKNFLKSNKEKYDIVYSLGFIEHFDNPEESIENHFKIAKKGGLVIIIIPNILYINKFFVEKNIVKIHNLETMRMENLQKLFKKYNPKELKYFGGLFNIGLFSYTNKFLEKIRFLCFVLQRTLIDPIFMILYKLGLNFSNKYTSPSIIIICEKN